MQSDPLMSASAGRRLLSAKPPVALERDGLSISKPANRRNAPGVTVIIPVFEVEAYLDECLGSVRRQSFDDLQIVIVDDDGSDGSLAIARRHARADDRIDVISHAGNRGLPSARNTGMKRARGNYVFHLDGDDYIAADAIEKLHRLAEETAADVTFCRGQVFREDGQWGLSFPPQLQRCFKGISPRQFMPHWQFMGAVLGLYRRAFLVEQDLAFDTYPTLGEDHIFIAKCLPAAKTISTLPEELYFYRRRPGSVSDYGDLDAATTQEFVACSQRVSALYANLRPVRQHYLLNTINAHVARMVVLAQGAKQEAFAEMTEGLARSFAGIDMRLVSAPRRQLWRPSVIVARRYWPVAAALAAGDVAALRKAVMDLARATDTPAVAEVQRLRRMKSPLAAEAAAEAARLEPDNPQALFIHAELALRAGAAPDTCLPALTKAARLAPEDQVIERTIAVAHLRARQYAEAESAIVRAVRIAPADSASHRVKSNVFLEEGKYAEAKAALLDERRLQPGLPRNYVDMARVALWAGQVDEAVASIQSMWIEAPGRFRKRELYWRQIAVLAGSGQQDGAISLLRRAPEPGDVAGALAGLVASALEAGASGGKRRRRRRGLWDELGGIHEDLDRAGQGALALAAAEAEVFSLHDGMSQLRRALAQLRLASGHARAGHAWSALRALRQAHRLEPRSAAFERVAATVVAALENRGEAEAAAGSVKLVAERTAEGAMTVTDLAPQDTLDA